MHRLMLAAGVAALAIAAPAAAKPEKKGGGGGAQASQVERGGGGGAQARSQNRGGGEARAQARSQNRGGERAAARAQARGGGEARASRDVQRTAARAQQRGGGEARAQRQEMRLATMQARGNSEARAKGNNRAETRARGNANSRIAEDRRGNNRAQARNRGNDNVRVVEDRRRDDRQQLRLRERERDGQRAQMRDRDRDRLVIRDGRRGDWNDRNRDRDTARDGWRGDWGDRDRWTGVHGLRDGCPPGLANKNPLCMPPGQYRKLQGSVLPAAYADNVLPRELRYLYPDSDRYYYRYGDGYAYRVNRETNLVSALLPLIGASLGIGQQFPYSSPAYQVPSYYQPFYPATDRFEYRYANGYIYEVDRYTGAITDIIPQYDHGYGVGQMLPASYSYYNLPQQYRQWYVDDDDYYYRYAPGSIYRVDRQTNLITSIVSLLAGGLGVGQQLPMGYNAYNVPLDYRDRYYDTPDSWYRYANGNIYQVDPTTRLITAIVQAIV